MLVDLPNRARSLGPPPRSFSSALAQQRYGSTTRGPRQPISPIRAATTRTAFSDYTGKSVGSAVGMYRRVPGMGRQFRG